MIRVTTLLDAEGRVTLRVEGSLRGADADTLRDALRRIGTRRDPVFLDLAGVTYMDAGGVRCVRELSCGSVNPIGCVGLVEELLREPGTSSPA